MARRLQQKTVLLFLAFFVLVLVSVLVTFWTLNTQQQDALVINLAGRQRMLVQQMTKETLQLSRHLNENKPAGDELDARRASLQKSTATFEQTLQALGAGGKVSYLPDTPTILPKTTSPEILTGLQSVSQTWTLFRSQIEIVRSPQSANDVQLAAADVVEQMSPVLVQQADEVVRLFEAASNRKIMHLRQIQIIFFGGAWGLLLFGVWATYRQILSPLSQLDKIATRIGAGDLDTTVSVTGPREMQILAESFDTMRRQLKRAQENLETRVTRRTRELAAAFELSQEIVTELTLEKTLSLVVKHAKTLTQAQTTVLCLLTPSGKTLNLAASDGEIPLITDAISQPANRGVYIRTLENAQPVTTNVMCADCQFLNHQSGVCAATPLRAGDKTLGALCVVRPKAHQFDPDEIRALSLLANSAAIAINNARLIQAEHVQTKQAAILAERNRLAAELHDNLAQTLSFLNLRSDQLSDLIMKNDSATAGVELNYMKTAIETAYGQVRTALVELQEPTSPLGDMADDLAACLRKFESETHISAELTIDTPPPPLLSRAVHTQALHVVREALTNIRRHAGANRVWVTVMRQNGDFRFSIKDDGRGFELDDAGRDNHFGLTIMRARVERSGGALHINTAPNRGTEIIAYFPAKHATQTTGLKKIIEDTHEPC